MDLRIDTPPPPPTPPPHAAMAPTAKPHVYDPGHACYLLFIVFLASLFMGFILCGAGALRADPRGFTGGAPAPPAPPFLEGSEGFGEGLS